ncbi:M23 family metallopeptidase [Qipengyuania sp. XHP0207]|uniref:M23 family metallopeptidase n=1 Tax=Qipengyuania sp. XHP0207 TaxID=3038078 RepID=UPI00241DAB68|nr:M23 family metallopeptidase [Qipengyuania sp. XHP0207]MDG5748110.1 M23 family metallopeptidase [Qipengyuania sp. XHP0207]
MYWSHGDSEQGGSTHAADDGAAAAATLAHDQIVDEPARSRPRLAEFRDKLFTKIASVDIALDLGSNIGSRRWFRGMGTFVGLSAAALAFWPSFAPLEAAPPVPVGDAVRAEYRSQMIMPLALGADSGRRMGATRLVQPLAEAPERPRIELVATLAQGDDFERMLRRAGLGRDDTQLVTNMVSAAMPLSEIESGTKVDIVLGRRPQSNAPRPLEELAFRARFDLELSVGRLDEDGPLTLVRKPIRVDDTPLRIRGVVGDSLYRSARAAGAPASAVQAYLKTLGQHVNIDREIRANDTFDFILAHRRAATGERQAGQLLYAGLERAEKPRVQLMRWGTDGEFYEASGVGEQRGGLMAPVPGRMSSRYGMRRHPILGYRRMHAGLDFKARHGTPIVAVTDGRVLSAGRAGGCGNAVKLRHGGGIDTRYCHMSRIAVDRGQSVRRGQVIGYVGSTGLSTGPHLHYEMYRGGRSINPASVKYVTRAQLNGAELARFRDTLAKLRTVEPGAALADLAPTASETANTMPQREIDKIDGPRSLP